MDILQTGEHVFRVFKHVFRLKCKASQKTSVNSLCSNGLCNSEEGVTVKCFADMRYHGDLYMNSTTTQYGKVVI